MMRTVSSALYFCKHRCSVCSVIIEAFGKIEVKNITQVKRPSFLEYSGKEGFLCRVKTTNMYKNYNSPYSFYTELLQKKWLKLFLIGYTHNDYLEMIFAHTLDKR